MTKHWRWASLRLNLRFGWLALVALLAQIVVIYVGFGEVEALRRLIFLASYVLLLAFVLLNWRRVGIVVIGAGMMLNFVAIASNGGLMPISPATMVEAGLEDQLAELSLGDAVPSSKNILLDESETHFRWLSDRITWDPLGSLPVYSPGDVIIFAGLIVILGELLFPLPLWPSRDRPFLA